MKQKRDKVFIWVTWLTKLIAGEQQCEFASWFRAHYQYDKKPSDFNLTKWRIKHNQLLHECRDVLEKQEYIVKLEDQNSFKLNIILPTKDDKAGHVELMAGREYLVIANEKESKVSEVTVSGKADIVGLPGSYSSTKCLGVVKDCKTGRPKNSDQVQVMLYMMFLPVGIKEYKDIHFDGNVVYPDGNVPIHWSDVDADLEKVVWDLIKRIGAVEPCRKTPSYGECRWCDITKENCSERVE